MDATEKEITRLSTAVRRGERRLGAAEKEEKQAKEKLVSVKAELKEVSAGLKGYEADKAKIEKAILANQKQMDLKITDYKKSL